MSLKKILLENLNKLKKGALSLICNSHEEGLIKVGIDSWGDLQLMKFIFKSKLKILNPSPKASILIDGSKELVRFSKTPEDLRNWNFLKEEIPSL
jgi:hypothetical protein